MAARIPIKLRDAMEAKGFFERRRVTELTIEFWRGMVHGEASLGPLRAELAQLEHEDELLHARIDSTHKQLQDVERRTAEIQAVEQARAHRIDALVRHARHQLEMAPHEFDVTKWLRAKKLNDDVVHEVLEKLALHK